jgi:hypothetical protein
MTPNSIPTQKGLNIFREGRKKINLTKKQKITPTSNISRGKNIVAILFITTIQQKDIKI